MGKREDFVIRASEWIGTKEGSSGHKQIVKDYNKSCDKGRQGSVDSKWCAMFVGAVAEETDNVLKDGIGVPVDYSCGTGSHSLIEKAKKAGIWVENDSYVPRNGDLVIYEWSDDGKGDCTSGHDHVGITSSVGASSFIVIEGNKKQAVGTRTVNINGRYIRGFITPRFADEVNPSVPSHYTGEFPTLPLRGYFKKGDKGKEVVKMQKVLEWISPGCLPKYGADGDIGNETINAVKICQSILGCTTDGLYGKTTQAKAKAYTK
jgi:hypothetical protein